MLSNNPHLLLYKSHTKKDRLANTEAWGFAESSHEWFYSDSQVCTHCCVKHLAQIAALLCLVCRGCPWDLTLSRPGSAAVRLGLKSAPQLVQSVRSMAGNWAMGQLNAHFWPWSQHSCTASNTSLCKGILSPFYINFIPMVYPRRHLNIKHILLCYKLSKCTNAHTRLREIL